MILETPGAGQVKKATEEKILLFNILTCLLCSSKAKIAHICPNCSKFYCQACIKAWIYSNNPYCPNCKGSINQNSIINCNKLSQDLSNALEALIQIENSQQLTCATHSMQQSYYCQDCQLPICSDCIVMEASHKGHNVVKLKKIKMQFNQQILQWLAKIRKQIKELWRLKQDANSFKSNQNEILKSKIQTLNKYMHKVKCSYEQNINQTALKFSQIFQNNNLKHISCSKMYEKYCDEIKELSKANLIRKKQSQLQQQIQRSLDEISEEFFNREEVNKIARKTQISNPVTSGFAQKTFILYNYTQIREKRQVVYSDSFFSGPLEWRLKVYPNGLEKKRPSLGLGLGLVRQRSMYSNLGEEYISIYIQLVSGVREGGRYRFSIQILNQSDDSMAISQVYEADFDTGKCWGYDQFANIATLYQKGYVLQQQDSLKISVSVGPPSYYFSTLDQGALIFKKQEIIRANQQKIQALRNNLHLIKQTKKQAIVHDKVQHQQQAKQQKHIIPSIESNYSNPEMIHTDDISTPCCRAENLNQINDDEVHDKNFENLIDFEKFVIEMSWQDTSRYSQQYDHQSVEMKKIYRRFTHLNQRTNLLLF